jgi:hypothetical protein
LNDPFVTVFVPVAPAPAGIAVKLNVPDTLEEVRVAMVSVPLPPRPDADQLPVSVVPLAVMTFRMVVLWGSRERVAALPGARLISELDRPVPGPNPSAYAFAKVSTQRNIYRVPVP